MDAFREYLETDTLEPLDRLMRNLNAFLPDEARLMWQCPASEVGVLLSVELHGTVIYFSGDDLSGQDFYNWVTFQDPAKLRQLLDLQFGLESRAKGLPQLCAFVRRAIAVAGVDEFLETNILDEGVVVTDKSNAEMVFAVPSDLLPLTYEQVKADVDSILDVGAPEFAETAQEFADLLASVNTIEFQGAFTFAQFDDHSFEITYQNKGKGLSRKQQVVRIWIDQSLWSEGIERSQLVSVITDEIKRRTNEWVLEASIISEAFEAIKDNYQSFRYIQRDGHIALWDRNLTNFYLVPLCDRVLPKLRKMSAKYCRKNGYKFNEVDPALFKTRSDLEQFIEVNLGHLRLQRV